MSNEHKTKANRYFKKSVKKVYIERRANIESFEEYLSHRYRDNCYHYSAYALMGLKSNDFLVRGNICIPGDFFWKDGGYSHGWVEFEFEGLEYVFDSMHKCVVPKQEWYELYKPRIDYKKTQKEILDEYLNERCAVKIKDGFWQFKYIVMNQETDNLSDLEIMANDKLNGYVPTILMLARVEEYNSEIKRFIAYNQPSY